MIETEGLWKSFRGRKATVEAVRGVDLSVQEGEVFGFLGPNGAGKTTTLRILATLVPPDKGRATVAGIDLRRSAGQVRRNIGYVAQAGGTWDQVSAREELILQARLFGIHKGEARRRATDAIEAFELTDFADRHCKTYSGGQRRRVDIALGVLHRPKVLFLDEPTAGLDPQSRAHVWAEVRRLRADGMTVFVTTHYMDEADALCDRVAIIDQGTIVAEGSPDELKREIAGDVVTLGVNGAAEKATDLLRTEPYVRRVEPADAMLVPARPNSPAATQLRLYVDEGGTAIPQILRLLEGAGLHLASIELHRPSLDDVFLEKTGRSLREVGD
ncbi:MAG: ATP-binding cassette domain-containing protein [Micromonosporaceae bacterium]|nr:ATP-binding cassette domain-containing protein [Micromonosporaceae bacterium]